MENITLKAFFGNDKKLILGNEVLEVADWAAGEKISISYDEDNDSIVLKNEHNIFDLQNLGALSLSDGIIEELTLHVGAEFTAVYDEESDTVMLTSNALSVIRQSAVARLMMWRLIIQSYYFMTRR